MPVRSPTPCRFPGCGETVELPGLCATHKKDVQRTQDARRGTAHQRGYTSRWSVVRTSYLRTHPFCARCSTDARLVAATVVDHITPHRGDKALFWDRANWQPLCKPCHDRKTATTDGAFGRT